MKVLEEAAYFIIYLVLVYATEHPSLLKTLSHFVAQTSLRLAILLPHRPEIRVIGMCHHTTDSCAYFIFKDLICAVEVHDFNPSP